MKYEISTSRFYWFKEDEEEFKEIETALKKAGLPLIKIPTFPKYADDENISIVTEINTLEELNKLQSAFDGRTIIYKIRPEFPYGIIRIVVHDNIDFYNDGEF